MHFNPGLFRDKRMDDKIDIHHDYHSLNLHWITKMKSLWTPDEKPDMLNGLKPVRVSMQYQGGRGHWTVYYTSPQRFKLFVGLTTLGTLIEYWLVGSKRLDT